MTPVTGKAEPPRKHRAGGTKIEYLGTQQRAVWIAAFNSDPNADKTYELTVSFKNRLGMPAPPPPPAPKSEPEAAPSSFGKFFPFNKR